MSTQGWPIIASVGFQALDWVTLGAYFFILIVSGWYFSKKSKVTPEDYFLGGRKMPAWAVSISIVATSMSAASFIGVPEAGYTGNLTYLSTNIGMIIAACVVAFVFIPAFYRSNSGSIYELLGRRFGSQAEKAASASFLIGRIMASGARLYIGAIPASMVIFGTEHALEPQRLILAISVMATIGIAYTLVGGITSVIWTDVLQYTILIGAAIGAIVVILSRIDIPLPQIIEELAKEQPDGTSKLTLIDTRPDPRLPFTLLTAIFGFTLLGIGSYGTDQDLAQRMLTCKNAKAGTRATIAGILLGIPSVMLFLAVGLLLWIFYQRPELFGEPARTTPNDSRQVFLDFILTQMPSCLTGLMMAGLFAAGLSSVNSAINAMSSAFVNDFYKSARPDRPPRHYVRVGRIGVIVCGVLLGAFACFCVFWQQRDGQFQTSSQLLNFALSVMTFAYAGLIAVFFAALFTSRGSAHSVILALITGFVINILLQPWVWGIDASALRAGLSHSSDLSAAGLWLFSVHFSWKLCIAVLLSFLVAAWPRGERCGS